MAKVDKTLVQFRGEWTTFEVHFTKSTQFYIKDCPGEIIQFGEFVNRNITLKDIIEQFKTAVHKAELLLQEERKVILVKFKIASAMLMTPNQDGMGSYIKMSDPLYRFCGHLHDDVSGYGFSIDYRIALEVTRGTERLYYKEHIKDTTTRQGALIVSDNETVIPYSEKAIESLEHIKASLKIMVSNISNFFSDADRLILALESGNLKLLDK